MAMISTDDPSRLWKGPGLIEVYVPPMPAPKPDDLLLDLPPGEPPVVRYQGVSGNYWTVLQTGQMDYMAGVKIFTEEAMRWLRQIQPEIEAKMFT